MSSPTYHLPHSIKYHILVSNEIEPKGDFSSSSTHLHIKHKVEHVQIDGFLLFSRNLLGSFPVAGEREGAKRTPSFSLGRNEIEKFAFYFIFQFSLLALANSISAPCGVLLFVCVLRRRRERMTESCNFCETGYSKLVDTNCGAVWVFLNLKLAPKLNCTFGKQFCNLTDIFNVIFLLTNFNLCFYCF